MCLDVSATHFSHYAAHPDEFYIFNVVSIIVSHNTFALMLLAETLPTFRTTQYNQQQCPHPGGIPESPFTSGADTPKLGNPRPIELNDIERQKIVAQGYSLFEPPRAVIDDPFLALWESLNLKTDSQMDLACSQSEMLTTGACCVLAPRSIDSPVYPPNLTFAHDADHLHTKLSYERQNLNKALINYFGLLHRRFQNDLKELHQGNIAIHRQLQAQVAQLSAEVKDLRSIVMQNVTVTQRCHDLLAAGRGD